MGLLHECPCSGKWCVLLWYNTIHIPSILNNLIPPFITREACVIVNYNPKVHAEMPTQEHCSIYFKDLDLNIPLSLHGIFSYFPPRSLTTKDISIEVIVLHITSNVLSWNPHSKDYAIKWRERVRLWGESNYKQVQSKIHYFRPGRRWCHDCNGPC